MKLKRIKFVHNPKSGVLRSPLIIRKSIERILTAANFDYDFAETQFRGHAKEIASQAAQDGYDAVVAIGGDGTTNEVASALLHSQTAAGIIPVGSGNGLAIGLGIPVSLRKATTLLMEGRIREIDAGCVEGKNFFIVTGMGFDAIVGKLFDEGNIRGPLPYFAIGLREFQLYRPEVFILKFDGKQVAAPALLVTIANMKGWGVGAVIAPHAEPDDGLLEICILHRIKLIKALFHLPKLFNGNIEKVRTYERYQAKSVQIIREKAGPIHFDGEPYDAGAIVNVSVDHRALKVVVPE